MLGIVQALLKRRFGADTAEALVGDLAQEYEARKQINPLPATTWLIRECLRLVAGTLRSQPRRVSSHNRSFLRDLTTDARFAFRLLRRSPGFAVVSALTLGAGIGATTTYYSVVAAVLIRPLPYPDSELIYRLGMATPDRRAGNAIINVAPPLQRAWAERLESFEAVAGAIPLQVTISGDAEPEFLKAAAVTGAWAAVFSIQIEVGRWFAPFETVSGGPVAVLSHGLWTRLGGRPDLIGQTITLNDTPHTVVGILPATYEGPAALRMAGTDVLVPIEQSGRDLTSTDNWFVFAAGKLRRDVSIAAADDELERVTRAITSAYPPVGAGPPLPRMGSLRDLTVGGSQSTILMLLGASTVLLLIACLNVAHLLLARSASRAGEFALRTAMGAGRARLARQMLVESLVIALLGGGVGVGISLLGVRLTRVLAPSSLPRLDEISVDAGILIFAAAVAIVTGVAFGMAPAWLAGRGSGIMDRRVLGDRASGRVQRGLIVVEVALAMVTAVGGGLLVNSFVRLVRVDPGFDPAGVIEVELTARGTYDSREARIALFDDIADRLAALPGLEAVSMTNGLPFGGAAAAGSYAIEGVATPPNDYLGWQLVGRGFFGMMTAAMTSGRTLEESDFRGAPPGVVVNQAFERAHFGGESAIGRRLKVIDSGPDDPWLTIVGVVRDMSPGDLARTAPPQVYVPFTLSRVVFTDVSFLARTDLPLETIAPSIREAVWAVDANQPVTTITPLTARIAESLVAPRFYLFLLGGFGLIGLVLTLSGTYGTVAYAVAQRTSEIGVRLALGATGHDITRLVLRMGLMPALAGIVAGVIGAGLLSRFLASFVYGISTTDVPTYVVVGIGLFGVAVFASWWPARRAAHVDPLLTLRGH